VERREPVGVQLRTRVHDVAGRPGGDHGVRLERTPQAGDVRLQRHRGVRRRSLAPERVDQPVGGHHRFDAGGELIGFSLKIRFTEVETNTKTGKTLHMRGSETEHWDLVAGTRTLTGAVFIGNQPGAGTFIHDTGRIVIDLETGEAISIAGPHEGFDNGVDETVCAALAS
jgi:hypothetical protein